MKKLLRFFQVHLSTPLLYVLIAACVLGANPFRGEVVGPFDLLASYPGWSLDNRVVEVRHLERSDVLDGLLPMWIETRGQIREGNVPLWNPLKAGGAPALFDPTNSLLTLPFAIFAATPDPAIGFYLAILACMVVAGWGMHCLVRRYFSAMASLFSGISYMLCGFMAAWLFWPHTFTAMWIPWLLLAVDRYVVSDRFPPIMHIALFTALMFLGGFPFVVAIGMGAAVAWAIVKSSEYRVSNIVPTTLGVLLGMGLGLMLVAVPLLSLIDTLTSTDLSYRTFGSPLTIQEHVKLLSRPWAQHAPRVESNMYIGSIALLAAIGGIFAGVLHKAKPRTLTWMGIIFTTIGVLLVFGLLSKEIGGHLPVLSNNPWSRSILLLDIGLILLAAAGLDWCQSRIRLKWAGGGILAGLCVVQLADLGDHFRNFNGATPKELFFPISPELAALKQRIRPFQYVGQDSPSFLISGTLGAAGLAEWYAHSLRSPPMREFLRGMASKPFTSPTATKIGLNSYHWSNPLLDAAGLCYAVSSDIRQQWPVLVKTSGENKIALPPIGGLLRQPVDIDSAATVPAIAIRLATYGETGLDGIVRLGLRNATKDGLVPEWSHLPASAIRDSQYAVFRFAKPVVTMPGKYEIQLRYEPGPKRKNLTVWMMADAPGKLYVDDRSLSGAIDYVIHQNGNGIRGLNTIISSGKMHILENPGCAEGPYFVAKASPVDPAKWLDRVKLTSYLPSRFTIAVDAPTDGYVIIPMRYQNGWRAEVNGRIVPTSLVAGVMPGIAVVAGRSSLAMTYRPSRLYSGLGITIAGLLTIFALAWLPRRANKLRSPNAWAR